VNIKKHNVFSRKGNDIYCDVPIQDDLLQKGVTSRVGTINGKRAELRIPSETKKGTVFKMPGLGARKNGTTGDQYVVII
ncbi:MAG: molecular chaperone DnaJ, partial [Calditrichaeota bacterium]